MIILKKKIKYVTYPNSVPGKKIITYYLFFVPVLRLTVEHQKPDNYDFRILLDSPRF